MFYSPAVCSVSDSLLSLLTIETSEHFSRHRKQAKPYNQTFPELLQNSYQERDLLHHQHLTNTAPKLEKLGLKFGFCLGLVRDLFWSGLGLVWLWFWSGLGLVCMKLTIVSLFNVNNFTLIWYKKNCSWHRIEVRSGLFQNLFCTFIITKIFRYYKSVVINSSFSCLSGWHCQQFGAIINLILMTHRNGVFRAQKT